jgi:tetratricopeptide (TPR) repeat protein
MTAHRKIARTLLALFLTSAVSAAACAATSAPAGTSASSSEPQKKKRASDEKNPQYQYEMGAIALRYGLTDEAVRYGKLGVSLDPKHLDSWRLLGSAYYTKGEFALAAEAYGRAAALKPELAEVQRNLGLAFMELKDGEKARAAFEKAYQLAGEGGDADSAYYLGRLSYTEKRYDEALDYAIKSIQENGKNARAYNLKGVALNQLGRFAEAAGSFQAGLVLAPDDIGLQVNLGIAYLNTNEPAKAKAVFEAVLPKIEEQVLRGQVENYLKSIKDAGK